MNNKYEEILKAPVFFERNRVFRVYKGGMLFSDFFGDEKKDGFYPEEWIASDVTALNKDKSDEKEGISKIEDTDIYFDDLIKDCKTDILGHRDDLGILVKILDSAVRLPVQVHPDKEFSKKHFNSAYGKAEAWIVLATRPGACIYYGFKQGVTRELLEKKVDESVENKNALEELIVKHDVKPGDAFFIPAKAVHCIGYGCMILEIQEPTDFTIQPEAWCDEYRLSDYEMYLGLSKQVALSCFDMSVSTTKAIESARVEPVKIPDKKNITVHSLIDKRHTDCFTVKNVTIDCADMRLSDAPCIYVITEGEGVLYSDTKSRHLEKGDYFMLPHCLKNKCTLSTDKNITFTVCSS